jgi:hypothetical protein
MAVFLDRKAKIIWFQFSGSDHARKLFARATESATSRVPNRRKTCIWTQAASIVHPRRRIAAKNELKTKKEVVGAWRFELQTSCAQGRRATRLRYAPTEVLH